MEYALRDRETRLACLRKDNRRRFVNLRRLHCSPNFAYARSRAATVCIAVIVGPLFSARRLNVNDLLSELSQAFVGFALLIKRLLKQVSSVIFAEHFRPRANGPVAGHLVMLNFLRRSNQSSIENVVIAVVLHDFRALLDQALHSMTGFAGRLLVEFSENF